MPVSPELHQQLLELVYDLLPEGDTAELRRQIAADPELAAALARVESEAKLLARAARLEHPPVRLRPPAILEPPEIPAPRLVSRPLETAGGAPVKSAPALAWAVALAAGVILAVTLGGYVLERAELARLARNHLRLVVTGPAVVHAGAPNHFSVTATSATGEPVAARVEYALFAPDGRELVRRSERADAEGQLDVALPADPAVQTGSRLLLSADAGDTAQRVETYLVVEPPRRITQLALDKPLYQPGETIRYRSLTLSRFGLEGDDHLPIRLEILDPAGAVLAGSELEGVAERGVGNGEFTLPPDIAGGEFTLVAKSLDSQFPDERRKFFVRQYRLPRLRKELEFTRDSYTPGDKLVADLSVSRTEGGVPAGATVTAMAVVDGAAVYQNSQPLAADGAAQIEFALPGEMARGIGQLAVAIDDGGTRETIAKTIPINLGKVEISFYPEGGDLVAGLESRVYFVGRNPQGEPVHVEGRVVDGQSREAARLETTHEGMGSFVLKPARGETYRVEISKPAGVENSPTLPAVSAERTVVLRATSGVVEAGKPLEFNVASNLAERPLVLVAVCRGVQVGQVTLTTKQGEQTVSLPLAAEAGGVVRVTAYDYENAAPQAIAERLVFRRPDRRLQVRVAGGAERYAPGEHARLSLVVTDEQNHATPAALGVAVVDGALLSLADDDAPGMSTHFFLTSEVEDPAELEDADFYLSDDAEAAEALDLLLSTRGWRRFAELPAGEKKLAGGGDEFARRLAMGDVSLPPFSFDNEDQIWKQYRSAAADIHRRRTERMATVGFFGSLLVLFFVAVLVINRLLSAPKAWVPAALAAAASLVMSVVELRLPAASDAATRQVAFAPFSVPKLAKSLGASTNETRGEVLQELRNKQLEGKPLTGLDLMRAMDGYAVLPPAGDAMLGTTDFAIDANSMYDLGDQLQRIPLFGVPADGLQNNLFFYAGTPADAMQRGGAAFGGFAGMNGNGQLGAMGMGGMGGGMQMWGLEIPAGGARNFYFRPRPGQLFDDAGAALGRPEGELDKLALLATGRYKLRRELGQLPALQAGIQAKLGDGMDELGFEQLAQELEKYRFPVRQYAHQHVGGQPGMRSDFAETLYWHPLLLADAEGRATIEFDLSDAVTTFRIQADAHAAGRLGSGNRELISRIPFSLEPKLPLEVTAGDRIDLPVAVANDTVAELPVQLELSVAGGGEAAASPATGAAADAAAGRSQLLKLAEPAARELKVPGGEKRREYFPLDVAPGQGEVTIQLRGTAGTLADIVQRKLKVVPPGFPVNLSYGGKLGGEQELNVQLPDDWIPGTLEVTLHAYPSPLADLRQGLEGLLREPNGCFEQASTSNYPNVLSLQYMQEHHIADPSLTRRAKELLRSGYGKLAGYECPKQGYEWFGGDPGHEALTAYGLMEFRDMAEVYDVDPQMVERTARWLRGRRNRRGGFERNARALDSFGGAPDDITDAYIVWALAEAGEKDLAAELDHVFELARDSDDPYLVALGAGATLAAGRDEAGRTLLEKLGNMQADDGHLTGKNGSITRSGGLSLDVETTALAALAWLNMPAFQKFAERAVEWIVAHRQGGGDFGSTQATILALKALVAHAKAHQGTVTGGDLVVMRDGREIARRTFAAGEHNTISIHGIAAELAAGDNRLTISLSGDNQMPYGLDVSYRSRTPASDAQCAVRLSTSLAAERVKAGETVALAAELENLRDEGQPMAVAILGLPAGLEPRAEQLDELKKAGTIDYYETRAREVICYWRSLAPRRKVELRLDLVAEIPGRYTAPASRAYLYYTAERKQWVAPLAVEITRD